jgi:hypothetical protein
LLPSTVATGDLLVKRASTVLLDSSLVDLLPMSEARIALIADVFL